MRVTMMLADHAQVADGKLFISGGGWSTCGPGPSPCAVAVLFHVPWQETDRKVGFTLRLLDEDGRGVHQPGPESAVPVHVNGHFEARGTAAVAPGSEITVPMCFNIILQLEPGGRYIWALEVDEHTDDAWQLPFATRQAQAAAR